MNTNVLVAKLKNPAKLFTEKFSEIALFGGIGLFIALIAVACDQRGVWL